MQTERYDTGWQNMEHFQAGYERGIAKARLLASETEVRDYMATARDDAEHATDDYRKGLYYGEMVAYAAVLDVRLRQPTRAGEENAS